MMVVSKFRTFLIVGILASMSCLDLADGPASEPVVSKATFDQWRPYVRNVGQASRVQGDFSSRSFVKRAKSEEVEL